MLVSSVYWTTLVFSQDAASGAKLLSPTLHGLY